MTPEALAFWRRLSTAARGLCPALAAALLLGMALPVRADLPAEIIRAFGLSPPVTSGREIADIQRDLLWIGHYQGLIDGVSGTATTTALRSFQASLDRPATGTLDAGERRTLAKRARDTREGIELQVEESDWTGIRMPVPRGYVSPGEVSGDDFLDVMYSGRAAVPFEVQQIRMALNAGSIDARFFAHRLIEDQEDAEVISAGDARGVGYFLTRIGDLKIYAIMETRQGEVRGVMIWASDSQSAPLMPVIAEVLERTELFSGPGVSFGDVERRILAGDYPGMGDRPDWYRTMTGSGSGSLVSTEGHILTNHHVVGACERITVQGQPATLIGADVRLDLALVHAPRFAGREPIAFRENSVELGERVIVLGYPVFSVTQSLNATEGLASSTVGFEGSRLGLQISAPVQPGNSGGPVLDGHGRQIAVVVSKAGKGLRAEVGVENMAWVIRGDIATEFLERYDIRYRIEPGDFGGPELVTREIVREQRTKALRVECH